MNRQEYPKSWDQDVIDALEKSPRWQEYVDGDLNPAEILEEWSEHHNGLIVALDTVRIHDNGSSYGRALLGIVHALKHSMTALEDIRELNRQTLKNPPDLEAEQPDS